MSSGSGFDLVDLLGRLPSSSKSGPPSKLSYRSSGLIMSSSSFTGNWSDFIIDSKVLKAVFFKICKVYGLWLSFRLFRSYSVIGASRSDSSG